MLTAPAPALPSFDTTLILLLLPFRADNGHGWYSLFLLGKWGNRFVVRRSTRLKDTFKSRLKPQGA
jgi:hypothetical protein